MNPKIRVYFYIYAFECTPDTITSVLGICSTKTWFKGDKIGKSTRTKSSNGWVLDSPLVNEPDPEIHIKWLLDQLPENLEALRSVTPNWSAQINIVLEMADDTPPFHFNPKTIARMAQLGLSLDVDMYIVSKKHLKK